MKRNQSEQTSNEFGEETNEEIHADFESQVSVPLVSSAIHCRSSQITPKFWLGYGTF